MMTKNYVNPDLTAISSFCVKTGRTRTEVLGICGLEEEDGPERLSWKKMRLFLEIQTSSGQ